MIITNTIGSPGWDLLFAIVMTISVPAVIVVYKYWPWVRYQWEIRRFITVDLIHEDIPVVNTPCIDLLQTTRGTLRRRALCTSAQIPSVEIAGRLYMLKKRTQSISQTTDSNDGQWLHITQTAELSTLDGTTPCIIEFTLHAGVWQLVNINCAQPIDRINLVYRLSRIK